MSYSVRVVPGGDFSKAVDIWGMAFGFSQEWKERSFRYANERLSTLLGAYEGDELQALAGIIDFELHLGDLWIPCGGICAVATRPPHRRRNVVNVLLRECLKGLHARRVPVSSLWPFSYPFYQRMGWATTDMKYSIESDLAPLRRCGDSRGYKQHPVTDIQVLMPLHERWVERSNLSIKRTAERWDWLLTRPELDCNVFVHQDGYMVWNLKKREGVLEVKEWAYLTEEAFLDGLTLLSQMDSQYRKAQWVSSEIDLLNRLGTSDPIATINVIPGMMSRVVHVDAFRELLPMKSPALPIRDSLGVSGPPDESGYDPGELVQLVTGFWRNPPSHLPVELNAVLAGQQAFSGEYF